MCLLLSANYITALSWRQFSDTNAVVGDNCATGPEIKPGRNESRGEKEIYLISSALSRVSANPPVSSLLANTPTTTNKNSAYLGAVIFTHIRAIWVFL